MMIRTIREEPTTLVGPDGGIEVLVHPEWAERCPGLVQGTTTRASDFAAGSAGPDTASGLPPQTRSTWDRLSSATGSRAAVHARQPHAARVDVRSPRSTGLTLTGPADGHLTRDVDVLLGVTVADCVPVTLHAPSAGVVGMVHAGWRSAAAGIMKRAFGRMRDAFGVRPADLEIHLGPSICGACYEVGPEVFAALGLDVPDAPTPIDLPGAIAVRAVTAGVERSRVTRSAWCTRCSPSMLWSHRGGDAGRQVGFVALRRPGSTFLGRHPGDR
jgi:YfiH family protein